MLDIWRIILGLVTALSCVQPVLGCGWWGDGEGDDPLRVLVIRADGTTARDNDPDQESPEAMIRIGDRFRTGSGGLLDLPMALHWYRAAAQRGIAAGQYNLAMMYEQGLGVARNYRQAAQWYRRAAEQDDVHAQHHLGELYRQGRGVPLDPVKAAHWLVRAAEQGHAEVFATVAGLYWEGNGVLRNELLAHVWWRLAADHGDASVVGDMRAAGAPLKPEAKARIQALVDESKRRWR